MNEIWLFIIHGQNNTWTRALVPHNVQTVRDLISYLQRGGKVDSDWMYIPERAKFIIPRAAGLTVLARLAE